MKYIHTETEELWDSNKSNNTKNTSNFNLLSHEEKTARGWELVEEEQPQQPSLEDQKQNKKNYVRMLATNAIDIKYPSFKRENASLGIYGDEFKTEVTEFIQGIIAKVDEYDLLVDNAQSIEDLEFVINYGTN
jgi:hypothetical protein